VAACRARSAHWLSTSSCFSSRFRVGCGRHVSGSPSRRHCSGSSRCRTFSMRHNRPFRALIEELTGLVVCSSCTRRGALAGRLNHHFCKRTTSSAHGVAPLEKPATRVAGILGLLRSSNQSSSSPRRSSRLIFQIVPVPGICTSGAVRSIDEPRLESAPPGRAPRRNPRVRRAVRPEADGGSGG